MGAVTLISGPPHFIAPRWGKVGTKWGGVRVSPPPHLPTSPIGEGGGGGDTRGTSRWGRSHVG